MNVRILRRAGLAALWPGLLSYCLPAAGDEVADGATRDPRRPVIHGSGEVTAAAIAVPTLIIIDKEKVRSTTPVGDGSEVLRDVTGADLGRMGGHGLEPYVRGLSQGDLTVLLDGATVHGGCPNRMDPASSYSANETGSGQRAGQDLLASPQVAGQRLTAEQCDGCRSDLRPPAAGPVMCA